jgi:hypothetical protein
LLPEEVGTGRLTAGEDGRPAHYHSANLEHVGMRHMLDLGGGFTHKNQQVWSRYCMDLGSHTCPGSETLELLHIYPLCSQIPQRSVEDAQG